MKRNSTFTIYTMGDAGFSTVQDPSHITAPKGQKWERALAIWERGKNITITYARSESDVLKKKLSALDIVPFF
jgi:hypothetical protein